MSSGIGNLDVNINTYCSWIICFTQLIHVRKAIIRLRSKIVVVINSDPVY